jgi:TM2 domain-containing membrane protein YozV
LENSLKNQKARRYKAYVSLLGTTQIHLRNPLVIAWWSAAFPGFGHLLLSKYLRGLVLIVWEVFINVNAKLNIAIVYSFIGEIDKAKAVLEPNWMALYIPVYLYAISDSYRTSVDLNRVYVLADRENARFVHFNIGALEINYLDKRIPWVAVMWSFFMPGLGQLYIHRVIVAFFVLVWWIVIAYFSHFFDAVFLLLDGHVDRATAKLVPQWLLFIPSVYGFATYDGYVNTVENNKLFQSEQANWLKGRYQHSDFQMPKSKL